MAEETPITKAGYQVIQDELDHLIFSSILGMIPQRSHIAQGQVISDGVVEALAPEAAKHREEHLA